MRPLPWTAALLRLAAGREPIDDVLGDLEEAHQQRARRHSRPVARLLTTLEAVEMSAAILRSRAARARLNRGSSLVQDYKLGFRMLAKYPGLTIAGGVALAIAIGLGAGWYDFTRDFWRPALGLPEGDRIVEVELRNAMAGGDERRILHDFVSWRQSVRTIEDLSAYRTLERNLILDRSAVELLTVAEMTASAFDVVRVPPLVGRPLLEMDERPGAAPVVLLGYRVWQRHFGGRTDAVGQTIQLGQQRVVVVGIMPEGFAFPINHQAWIPLPLEPSGYAPLKGVGIRVFGRLEAHASQAEANVELVQVVDRTRALSPQTHEYLRPRVLAYGGESPGDRPILEVVLTHMPIAFVLLIACVNVGTLIYARTATREAEMATRYALGASRGRIISQLFVEALVLAAMAAVIGLFGAHTALDWGIALYYAGQPGGMPFWIRPGLEWTTIIFGAGLTIVGAAMLSILPALKVTGRRVQEQIRNLGSGGATLRFGKVWTAAMIGQVAITVILLPPAMGISEEAWRDRIIRARFPTEQYLALRLSFDAATPISGTTTSVTAERLSRLYDEFERRVREQPGVLAVTYADRLPGMDPAVQTGEVETRAAGEPPALIPHLWTTAVGPGFFETFGVSVIAGRDFHDGDRRADSRSVLVNEAFVRQTMDGASPVGRRVRFVRSNGEAPDPWFEIVGVVEDIGMTPTDLGEGAYLFRAASPTTVSPLVMGIKTADHPAAHIPGLRNIALGLDPSLRLDETHSLDELTWRVETPMLVMAGAATAIVGLGLFLSGLGIFSLMSVSVARRTREIGLRAALGATRGRLLAGIFSRALTLIGAGLFVGHGVLLLFVYLNDAIDLAFVASALFWTSMIMPTVGVLACCEPARRALRIAPTDALKNV